MNKIIALFFMLLLLIILLLIIGILIIFLWCVLLIFRSLSFYLRKEQNVKEKTKNKKLTADQDEKEGKNLEKDNKKIINQGSTTTASLNSREEAIIVRKNGKLDISEEKSKNVLDNIETKGKGKPEYIEKYKDIAPMDIITGEIKNNLIRLSVISPREKNNYNFVAQFKEDPNGKLSIFKEEADTFLVIPISDTIAYKDFSYGDIGNSFIFNKKVEPSKQYKIVGISKICKMKKDDSGHLIIIEKGSLEIEEIHY